MAKNHKCHQLSLINHAGSYITFFLFQLIVQAYSELMDEVLGCLDIKMISELCFECFQQMISHRMTARNHMLHFNQTVMLVDEKKTADHHD